MNVRCVYPTGSRLFSVLLLAALVAAPPGLRAQGHLEAPASFSTPLSSIKVVDVFNLFPNVGALIYFAGPNDFGSSSSNAFGVRWTPALPPHQPARAGLELEFRESQLHRDTKGNPRNRPAWSKDTVRPGVPITRIQLGSP